MMSKIRLNNNEAMEVAERNGLKIKWNESSGCFEIHDDKADEVHAFYWEEDKYDECEQEMVEFINEYYR